MSISALDTRYSYQPIVIAFPLTQLTHITHINLLVLKISISPFDTCKSHQPICIRFPLVRLTHITYINQLLLKISISPLDTCKSHQPICIRFPLVWLTHNTHINLSPVGVVYWLAPLGLQELVRVWVGSCPPGVVHIHIWHINFGWHRTRTWARSLSHWHGTWRPLLHAGGVLVVVELVPGLHLQHKVLDCQNKVRFHSVSPNFLSYSIYNTLYHNSLKH